MSSQPPIVSELSPGELEQIGGVLASHCLFDNPNIGRELVAHTAAELGVIACGNIREHYHRLRKGALLALSDPGTCVANVKMWRAAAESIYKPDDFELF